MPTHRYGVPWWSDRAADGPWLNSGLHDPANHRHQGSYERASGNRAPPILDNKKRWVLNVWALGIILSETSQASYKRMNESMTFSRP